MIDVPALLLVASLSGLYTAAWGAFKDGPYEGFRWTTFMRSILFSVVLLLLLLGARPLRERLALVSLGKLFLLVMGMERISTEIYKACFRDSDQTRFAIPQHLTILGRAVHDSALRAAVGVALLAIAYAVLSLRAPVESRAGFALVACGTGLFICVAGAYKDAPFEGFQPRKFLRSAIVLTAASPILYRLGPTDLGFLIYTSGGLERLLIEYYKSYVLKSVPGKFRADTSIVEGEFLRYRPLLRHLATLLLIGVVLLLLDR